MVAHVQIGGAIDGPTDLDVVRIPLGTADLMLAADLAVAGKHAACWSATPCAPR